MTVRTVGHGNIEAEAFTRLVRDAGIGAIVDVRRYPGSRRHPQFRGEDMAHWLGEADLDYRWLPALGGRRSPVARSPNVALRNPQFQGYADHMANAEFAGGLAELLASADAGPVGVMCAESLWWRCHRRLLADHLVLVDDVAVEHLFHDGHLDAHPPTPEARLDGTTLVYDVGVQQNLRLT